MHAFSLQPQTAVDATALSLDTSTPDGDGFLGAYFYFLLFFSFVRRDVRQELISLIFHQLNTFWKAVSARDLWRVEKWRVFG